MTKTVSLSDEAYDDLVEVKRPGESFSELARRLAALERRSALFDPAVRLGLGDAEAARILAEAHRGRDASLPPRGGER